MNNEEKELLIKDLSARLPYGVILRQYSCTKDYYHNSGETIDIPLNELIHSIFERGFLAIRPYLRPMSSMTEEEKKEMHEKLSPTGTAIYKEEGISIPLNHYGEWIPYEYMSRIIDYLIAHHFDYRGLIPKGLAVAVTEENNPYKE